jgi:hypothetical protein
LIVVGNGCLIQHLSIGPQQQCLQVRTSAAQVPIALLHFDEQLARRRQEVRATHAADPDFDLTILFGHSTRRDVRRRSRFPLSAELAGSEKQGDCQTEEGQPSIHRGNLSFQGRTDRKAVPRTPGL